MKLQILVPQYKETDEIIKPLLDTIMIQKNIDFKDIGVIIVNDGSDIRLTEKFLSSYPFNISYILNKHQGVSGTRNCCLDHATADYVMFCDADDMFLNITAFQLILETIDQYPFEAMTSAFMEELITSDGTHIFNQRDNDSIFVHGKIYNRQFLIEYNIRWEDELLIHEDSYFNCLALSVAKNKRYCNKPFYVWCWNSNSVSRQSPDYVIKTYHHLIKSADKLSEALLQYGEDLDSAKMFVVNIFQTYYLMTGVYSQNTNYTKILDNLTPLARNFYDRFCNLFNLLNEKEILDIRQNARQAARDHGWYKETITFPQWVKLIHKIKEDN